MLPQNSAPFPGRDVRRRFHRGWANFQTTCRALADARAVYDNSAEEFQLIQQGP